MKTSSIECLTSFSSTEDHVLFTGICSDGATVRIRVSNPSDSVFRIQMAWGDETIDSCGAAQTLARMFDEKQYEGNRCEEKGLSITVEEKGSSVQVYSTDIANNGPSLEVGKSPFFIRLVKPEDRLATEMIRLERRISASNEGSSIGSKGRRNGAQQAGEVEEWDYLVEGTLDKGEHIYGTGQRFNSIDQRGKKVAIWAIADWLGTGGNSYVPIPFFISTGGYGVYLNRFEKSSLDLGAESPNRWRCTVQAAPMDLYFFLHSDPAEIIRAYTSLTGLAPLPPEWSFGIHVCRHSEYGKFATPDRIRNELIRMEEKDLPFSSVFIESWDTYNTDTYDEMKEIVDELQQKGKKVLVYAPCGRFPDPHFTKKGKKAEEYQLQHKYKDSYMVHNTKGDIEIEESDSLSPGDPPYRLRSRFVDITNPKAVSWWLDEVWRRLVQEIGIDGAKIDFCEQFPEHGGIRFYDGRSSKGMHHLYPVMYNIMMYRYFQEHRTEGGMCFSRGGGIGAQRYPFMWCGDQLREWCYLQAILKALLSSGLSGVPFMTHDLAGYMPSETPEDNEERAVFIRGTQLACFSANMELMSPANQPYEFDEKTNAIFRAYANIHYKLIPYLREQAQRSCSTGIPLLRHLYLSYPEDKNVYDIEDQYMLGDDLLVAPVLEDILARTIYFPQGEWRCIFTGQKVIGPETEEHWDSPLNYIPVFIREKPISNLLEKIVSEIREIFLEAEDAIRQLEQG